MFVIALWTGDHLEQIWSLSLARNYNCKWYIFDCLRYMAQSPTCQVKKRGKMTIQCFAPIR